MSVAWLAIWVWSEARRPVSLCGLFAGALRGLLMVDRGGLATSNGFDGLTGLRRDKGVTATGGICYGRLEDWPAELPERGVRQR